MAAWSRQTAAQGVLERPQRRPEAAQRGQRRPKGAPRRPKGAPMRVRLFPRLTLVQKGVQPGERARPKAPQGGPK